MNRDQAIAIISKLPEMARFDSIEKAMRLKQGAIREAFEFLAEEDGDSLTILLEAQKNFMKLLDIPFDVGEDFIRNEYFTSAAVKLAVEASEVLDAQWAMTNPWKKKTDDEVRAHVLEEITDVLFFILELFAIAGFDANDIVAFYGEKLKSNLKRVAQSSTEHAKEAILWRISMMGRDSYDYTAIREALYEGDFNNFVVSQKMRLGGQKRVRITGEYTENKWKVIPEGSIAIREKVVYMDEDQLIQAIMDEINVS